jgi:hypothetical protein
MTKTDRETARYEQRNAILGIARSLVKIGIAPTVQAFEQVIHHGLLDGIEDVWIGRGETLSIAAMRDRLRPHMACFRAPLKHSPKREIRWAIESSQGDPYKAVAAFSAIPEGERNEMLARIFCKAMYKGEPYVSERAVIMTLAFGLNVQSFAIKGAEDVPWLFYGCALEDQDVTRALLLAGADPNEQDSDGYTAQHVAAANLQWGVIENRSAEGIHWGVIKNLLDAGADPLVRNNEGKRPEELLGDVEPSSPEWNILPLARCRAEDRILRQAAGEIASPTATSRARARL